MKRAKDPKENSVNMTTGSSIPLLGRRGLSIPREIYLGICDFIVGVLESEKEIHLFELLERTKRELEGDVRGELPWYILNVKQDLEARDIIQVNWGKERVPFIQLKRRYHLRLRLLRGEFS